jgi:hypothetical protein
MNAVLSQIDPAEKAGADFEKGRRSDHRKRI